MRMSRKMGFLTKEGMIWSDKVVLDRPIKQARPQVQQSISQELGCSLPLVFPISFQTSVPEVGKPIDPEHSDNRLFEEVLHLNTDSVSGEPETDPGKAPPWMDGEDFSLISSATTAPPLPVTRWPGSSTGLDRLSEWALSNDCVSLTENLTQTLQDSLDLLLTSPFFSSFAQTLNGAQDHHLETVLPDQQAVFLQEVFPANFSVMEVAFPASSPEGSHTDFQQREGVDGGTRQPGSRPCPEFACKEAPSSGQSECDTLRAQALEVVSSGVSSSECSFPVPEKTIAGPSGVDQISICKAARKTKRKGLTFWELFQKRKENAGKHSSTESKHRKRGVGRKLSRKSYSIQFKMKMVEMYGREMTKTQLSVTDFCQRHQLDPKMFKTWALSYDSLKCISSPKSSKKRIRSRYSRFPLLETEILKWIRVQQSTGARLSQRDVIAFAKDLSVQKDVPAFRASLGWVKRFTERNSIELLRGKIKPE